MKYVYLIRSISRPNQRYIGLTEDVDARVAAHNAGSSTHTAKFRPWELVTVMRFEDDQKAADFERYLKTGSGWAFANRHLW